MRRFEQTLVEKHNININKTINIMRYVKELINLAIT